MELTDFITIKESSFINEFDINSDHKLVRAKISLKIKDETK